MSYKINYKGLDASASRKQIEAILLSYGYVPKKQVEWHDYTTYGEYKNSSGKFIDIEYKLKVINAMEDIQDLPISRKVQQIIDELKNFGFMLPAEWAKKNVPPVIHDGLIAIGLNKAYMLLYEDRIGMVSYCARERNVPDVVHLDLEKKEFDMMLGNAGREYKLSPVAVKVYRLFDSQNWELKASEVSAGHSVTDWWIYDEEL